MPYANLLSNKRVYYQRHREQDLLNSVISTAVYYSYWTEMCCETMELFFWRNTNYCLATVTFFISSWLAWLKYTSCILSNLPNLVVRSATLKWKDLLQVSPYLIRSHGLFWWRQTSVNIDIGLSIAKHFFFVRLCKTDDWHQTNK